MKHTKRVFSLLLSLLLALLLLVPAAAEDAVVDAAVDVTEDAPVDAAAGDPSYAPIIVTQPKKEVGVRVGKTLKLSVEAQLPAAGGELSYAWYEYNSGTTLFSTDAELVLPVTKDMLKKTPFPPEEFLPLMKGVFPPETKMVVPGSHYFYVVATNTYRDDDGVEQSVSVASDYSRCYVYQGLFSAIGTYAAFMVETTHVFALLTVPIITILYTLLLHPITLLTAMGMNLGKS